MRHVARLMFVMAVLAAPMWARQRVSGYCMDGGQAEVTAGIIASGIVAATATSPDYTVGTAVMGNFPGCQATVYNTGTLVKATIYQTDCTTASANPVTSSSVNGLYQFCVDNGIFDIVLSGAGITTPITVSSFTVLAVGGSDDQLQVNCSGLFCGYSGLTWDTGTNKLTATNEAITTALTIGGGSSLTTSNQSGTGSITMNTGPTITDFTLAGTGTITANNTFSGTNSFIGGMAFNIISTTGNAVANLNASKTGPTHTSTANLEAVVTNNNDGEFQFQIADASPFGWRFCATNGGFSCPVKIGGQAQDQLVDIGAVLSNQVLLKYPGDTILGWTATNGGHSTAMSLKAVTSTSLDGDAQWQISTASPRGWRFNATGGTGVIVDFHGTAPAGSLVLNADGTLSVPGAVRTNTSANTDQAGSCVLGTSCGPARTFAATYATAPICVATDNSNANATKVVVTTTTLTITGSGTDTISYVCVPRT